MVCHEDSKALLYSNMFNCSVGGWPIKYLGVPVSDSRLHIADWIPLDEKNAKKVRLLERLFTLYWRKIHAD